MLCVGIFKFYLKDVLMEIYWFAVKIKTVVYIDIKKDHYQQNLIYYYIVWIVNGSLELNLKISVCGEVSNTGNVLGKLCN